MSSSSSSSSVADALVHAIAYPRGRTDEAAAHRMLYLTESEVREAAGSVSGRPVWIEHTAPAEGHATPSVDGLLQSPDAFARLTDPGNTRVQIGTVESGSVNKDGQLEVVMRIDRRHAAGVAAVERMRRGELGVSVGQRYRLNDALDIEQKFIDEISVVADPHFPEARVISIDDDTPEFRATKRRLTEHILREKPDLKTIVNLDVSNGGPSVLKKDTAAPATPITIASTASLPKVPANKPPPVRQPARFSIPVDLRSPFRASEQHPPSIRPFLYPTTMTSTAGTRLLPEACGKRR